MKYPTDLSDFSDEASVGCGLSLRNDESARGSTVALLTVVIITVYTECNSLSYYGLDLVKISAGPGLHNLGF